MICWYTDNALSHQVMDAIHEGNGYEVKHIMDFQVISFFTQPVSVLYGILRGGGHVMHILGSLGLPYYYIDNGYFDADYVDSNMQKKMQGKFRVVKNDMVEAYGGDRVNQVVDVRRHALVIPPSPYTANHYDTTPEDWLEKTAQALRKHNIAITIRDKKCEIPLEVQLNDCGFVVSFNSMITMEAIKRGIPAYDSHGIFRNISVLEQDDFKPTLTATYEMLREYYEPKQFTLEEFRQGKWKL